MWTGEFATDADDVAIADLSIGRSYATYDQPASAAGIFGSGWSSDLGGVLAGMAGHSSPSRAHDEPTTMPGTWQA
ncbi:hypothetical protein C8K30_102214 [Promicromonospora sp. AC04]|nr:hypothetical protein C8K30_102214 [Promicromonospora sp. AC04]